MASSSPAVQRLYEAGVIVYNRALPVYHTKKGA